MEKYERKPLINYDKETVKFQAIEWCDSNIELVNEMVDIDEDYIPDNRYTVRAFGVTPEGHSICLTINGFTPFFYVKIPDSWDSNKVNGFIHNLVNMEGYYYGKPYRPLKKWSKNLLREKCLIQKKKDFYGFSGEKQFKFLRLTFNNSEAMKKFSYAIGNHNDPENKARIECADFELKLYESNLDSILKFMHIRNLKPSGWITTDKFEIKENCKATRCQIEASCHWNTVSCETENEENAPILQASFDIEVFSVDGTFPVPTVKENCVTQIATSFKYFGQDEFVVKHIICLKECAPIVAKPGEPEIIVEWYLTEKEVLIAWRNLVNRMDPDVLYTYNGDQFDGNYLHERAKITRCLDKFLDLSKMKETSAVLQEKQFSSSAYGTSNYKRLSIPGRLNFDILIYIQREYKENSYKLDSIAEKYLGQNKNEMTPQNMFDFFASGDPEKIKTLAQYCIQDTLLPQRLADKMHILQNQISMSNVTYVPFKYLIERGQSIKAFSQILRETRKNGYLVPCIRSNFDSDRPKEEESFVGATVLAPTTGAYFEPITVCDFASLYPSIIRAHNLCFSTIVLDEKYANVPGVEYKTLDWEDVDKESGEITKHSYKYAQSVEGILPGLLKELTASRKKYKKLMADAKDAFSKEIYNKCQKAVKVSMNSIYGFLAAPMLCCKPIAATVTAYGRNMIADTKKFMEDNYNASSAVYGDSLTKDTPLLLRDPYNGLIHIETFESLFDKRNVVDYPGFKVWDLERKDKEYSSTTLQAWTDCGWQNIKKVIRHHCNKKIYEVYNGSGYVKVTEDHSLLSESKEILTPMECEENTKLLTSYPRKFNELYFNLTEKRAYLYGLFCKKGHVKDDTVVFDDLTFEEYNVILAGFQTEYPGIISKFIEKDEKTVCLSLMLIDPEYFETFYAVDGNKQVPVQILNGSVSLTTAFLTGYDSLEGIADNDTIGAGVYFLSKKLGINRFIPEYLINSRTAKDFLIVDEMGPTEDFVFDLETECGRFQAGVGDIIVKNTDSVFIKFKTKTTDKYNSEYERIYSHTVVTDNDKKILKKLKVECIRESMELGKEAAEKATESLFIEPISLEYEKVYCPLLLLSKKRYIGELHSDNPEKMDYLDNKGVVLTRRDNFQLLRECYQKMVDIFMENGKKGLPKALEYINGMIDDIKNNCVDKDKLIVTKTLKGPYKSQNIPHVVLAKKIGERDPGAAPRQNDRIPYIFIDNGFLKATTPQYMKVEDPVFAKDRNLPVDTEYYIKYLMNPLCEILELFMDKPEEMFKKITMDYRKARLAKLKKASA
jgi:DNA polymerase elongation subunit (family B)